MSDFTPKISEAYIFATQQENPVRIFVVIPEDVPTPVALEFLYVGGTRDDIRPFVLDHEATVTARTAMTRQAQEKKS